MIAIDRLDRALASRGLARSRTAASRLIDSGVVRVNGAPASRPSMSVGPEDTLEVGTGPGYVSRAAGKLIGALTAFGGPDPAHRVCLDIGASTGGFTQVLLERGATEVVALDVGRDQLDPLIRADTRVTVVEGVNARDLDERGLDAAIRTNRGDRPPLSAADVDLVVGDLSFISLRLILPALRAAAPSLRDAVVLIKPQFEVGRTHVRGGLVTDEAIAGDAVIDVLRSAADVGLDIAGLAPSPVTGLHGNRELLAHLRPGAHPDPGAWESTVRSIVRAADRHHTERRA